MTTSASSSSHAAASDSTLPLPRNVAGIRLAAAPAARAATTVAPAADGEAGEFVERMFGIEVAGGAAEEPDERRTLAADRAMVEREAE